VHAAAVGWEDGTVLLAGVGGSGKSTTALLSLAADMRYAGDDYCLISVEPEPRVFGLYGSAKVHWNSLFRVASLLEHVEFPRLDGGEKAVLFVHEALPARMLRTAPIRAVVLPRVVTGGLTRIVPVTPAAGMRALAPSTVFQLLDTGRRSFGAVASLVRRVPSFRLDLGADAENVPAVLSDLLRGRR
jgi:hypothetical protein